MLICICVHAIVCTVCGLTVEAVCSIMLRLWDRRWAMRLILALRKVLTSAPFVADIYALDTEVSSAADFYPKVKAAWCHESVDSEKDRRGSGCRLGQGQ